LVGVWLLFKAKALGLASKTATPADKPRFFNAQDIKAEFLSNCFGIIQSILQNLIKVTANAIDDGIIAFVPGEWLAGIVKKPVRFDLTNLYHLGLVSYTTQKRVERSNDNNAGDREATDCSQRIPGAS
jgi:hypothetical protein